MDVIEEAYKVIQNMPQPSVPVTAELRDESGHGLQTGEARSIYVTTHSIDKRLSIEYSIEYFGKRFSELLIWKLFEKTHEVPQAAFDLSDLSRRSWPALFVGLGESQKELDRKEIFASHSHVDVLNVLSRNDLVQYVEDYHRYIEHRQEILEDGESPGIILQSLQSWAWFLIDFVKPSKIPYAKIDADFDGCIELTWRLSSEKLPHDPDNEYYGNGRGLVHLTFFPSYLNYLSVFSGAYEANKQRIGFDGWFSHTKTKQVLHTFSERLQSARRSLSSETSSS